MNAPAKGVLGFSKYRWFGPSVLTALLLVGVRYLATGYWTPYGPQADGLLWWPSVLIFGTACAACSVAFLFPARHGRVLTSRVIAVLMLVLPSALAGLIWLYKDYHEVLMVASSSCMAGCLVWGIRLVILGGDRAWGWACVVGSALPFAVGLLLPPLYFESHL